MVQILKPNTNGDRLLRVNLHGLGDWDADDIDMSMILSFTLILIRSSHILRVIVDIEDESNIWYKVSRKFVTHSFLHTTVFLLSLLPQFSSILYVNQDVWC